MPKKIRPGSNYWRRREEAQQKKNIKDQKEYDKQLKSIYLKAMDNIQKEIDSFYARYAKKEGITLAEAKKRASKLDMEEYSRKAKRYVDEKDFSKEANDEMRLYNMTMKVNRLELLKAKIGLELVDSFNDLQKYFDQKLTERTLDEFKRQAGILGDTVMDTELAKRARALVNASFRNAKWSDRIWMYQDLLKNKLDDLLRTGLIQGRNSRELARDLRKAFDVSRHDAERLMRTEMCRVQTDAQKDSFERNGFEEYEYVCCGLPDACEICRALDGKIFKVKDMMPGENAPPMHPNDHCSTAAHYANRAEFDAWLDAKAAGETGLGFEEFNKDVKEYASTSDDINANIKNMRVSSSKSTKTSLEYVYKGKAGLNKHRSTLLSKVPKTGDFARLPNGSVTNKDLAYLSASEKHEFALWRSKTEEVLCHGSHYHCDLPDDIYDELLSGKYKLIAHTHVDRGVLVPSQDDMDLLIYLGQKKSTIIGIDGQEHEFYADLFDF